MLGGKNNVIFITQLLNIPRRLSSNRLLATSGLMCSLAASSGIFISEEEQNE
jgi:hypothetical protein